MIERMIPMAPAQVNNPGISSKLSSTSNIFLKLPIIGSEKSIFICATLYIKVRTGPSKNEFITTTGLNHYVATI